VQKKLSQINVGSIFRVSLILGGVAGVLVGFVLMVIDFMDRLWLQGAVTLVLAPILYGVVGAAVNALMAWVYNLVAGRFGGVVITLDDQP